MLKDNDNVSTSEYYSEPGAHGTGSYMVRAPDSPIVVIPKKPTLYHQ